MTRKVFVLGAGRSGTKILRDCLGAARDVAAVPYDVGYVWRFGNERIPHDELSAELANPRIATFVDRSLERMARRASRGSDYEIVLEKSVPNTLRPAFMAALFPEARFVHIVRNGYSVIESAVRNWQEPEDRGYLLDKLRYFPIENYRYALWGGVNLARGAFGGRGGKLWGPRYDGMGEDVRELPLLEVCTRQWQRCLDVCDMQLNELDRSRFVELSYEELLGGADILRRICRFCEIDDEASVAAFYRQRFDPRRGERRAGMFSEDERDRIRKIAGNTLDRYGHV